MKTYSYRDYPFRIDGLPLYNQCGELRRYPDFVLEAHPRLNEFNHKLTACRLRFAVRGHHLKVRIVTTPVYFDRGMSFYQVNCGYIFVGDYSHSQYARLITTEENPLGAEFVEGEIDLPDEKTEVTVWLPRNPGTKDIIIETDDDACLYEAQPYGAEKPVVFYGSSITECGITTPFCSYTGLVSRRLNTDIINLGASGNAKGEPEMADFIGSLPMSVFCMDYDHNAPSAEHLRNTHRAFFERFRSHQPDTPVIITSKPAVDWPDTYERRDIITDTYRSAVDGGDKNVYFIDGLSFFDGVDREICTIDRIHPNDLGHYLMAEKYIKIISEITGLKPV